MPDDDEATMILYADVPPKEKAILQSMAGGVLKVLFENFITDRLIWTGSAESGERVVQLILPAQPEPRILLQLRACELAALSLDELVSRLNESIRQS